MRHAIFHVAKTADANHRHFHHHLHLHHCHYHCHCDVHRHYRFIYSLFASSQFRIFLIVDYYTMPVVVMFLTRRVHFLYRFEIPVLVSVLTPWPGRLAMN